MITALWIIAVALGFLALAYVNASGKAWGAGIAVALVVSWALSALPHLPRKELSWRLHFIMGALSYTLAGTDALKIIAELNPLETDNDEILLRRLAPFLLAGLTAPLPDLTDVARELDHEPPRAR